MAASYPEAEERGAVQAMLPFMASPSVGVEAHAALPWDVAFRGLWLKSQDARTIGQFRIDGFTFNRLRPYTSWEAIIPEALRLWHIYAEIVRPRGVTRLSVRYINRLPLPGPGIDLDHYILTAPKLPESIPQIVSTFATRAVLEHPERLLMANVAQVLEISPLKPDYSVLLDIDVYRVGDLPVDEEVLRGILDDLRVYKNQIFFGSLTESFVSSFA